MQILWLSNSNDDTSRPGIRAGRRRPELMASALAAAVGEPVDVVVKPIWPAEALPGIVERRMAEVRPDVVWLNVPNYWINYESTPLRLKRWLGPFGTRIAGAGFRTADRLGEHRMFRWARTLLQITIGGDTHFTPQQVLERVSECARVILRDESVVLVIEGPRDRQRFYGKGRARQRMERRRLWLHGELRDLAGRMHCTYHGSERPLREEIALSRMPDAFHMDAGGHAVSSEMDFRVLLEAVQGRKEQG